MLAVVRDFMRECELAGVEAELIRDKKHLIYRLRNKYGATKIFPVSRASTAEPRLWKNRRRDLRKFSEERP